MSVKENKYRYLRRNTILFTISSFGPKILSFLLVPLYTNCLTTSEYGIADLLTTTATLLIYIFTLNISESVLRFGIEKDRCSEVVLYHGLKILGKGSCLVIIGIVICKLLNLLNWQNYCYIFLFANFFMTGLNQILLNYLRAIDKIVNLVISSLFYSVISVCSNLVFLVGLDLGLLGYLLSFIVAAVVSNLYIMATIKFNVPNFLKAKSEKNLSKDMVRYSFPLVFNSLAWWINNCIDKYFVTAIVGVVANGVYAVSYKIPTILSVVQSIFSQAFTLSSIKEFDREDKDGFFAQMYSLYNVTMVLACSCLVILNIPIASILFANEFFEAWKYSPFLLFSTVFGALSGYVGTIFTAVKDSKVFAISTVVGAMLNTLLNAVLIPYYGVYGAAVATAISYFGIWAIRMVCVKKYINWKINIPKDMFGYFLLCIQIFFAESELHGYTGQIVIFIVLMIMYYKEILKIVRGLLKRK